MMSLSYLLAGATLLLLTVFYQKVEADDVSCYVCSWSPKENRTDEWCTNDNFMPKMANVMHCSKGCEHVFFYDNNNELELFHRNCYTSNLTIDEGCQDQILPNYRLRRCFCNAELCNTAPALSSGFLGLLAVFLPICILVFPLNLFSTERLI